MQTLPVITIMPCLNAQQTTPMQAMQMLFNMLIANGMPHKELTMQRMQMLPKTIRKSHQESTKLRKANATRDAPNAMKF